MHNVPNFNIDHRRLVPGIYVLKTDDIDGTEVVTYDIRITRPNFDLPMTPEVMHTIEHMGLIYLKNHPTHKDNVIGWFPGGSGTGFYLVYKGRLELRELAILVLSLIKNISEYTGNAESIGFDPDSCGNYTLCDIEGAKLVASNFLVSGAVLGTLAFEYPTADNSPWLCTSSKINGDDALERAVKKANRVRKDVSADYTERVEPRIQEEKETPSEKYEREFKKRIEEMRDEPVVKKPVVKKKPATKRKKKETAQVPLNTLF